MNALIQGDLLLGSVKRKALKEARNRKSTSAAAYLSEVWVLSICNGINRTDAQNAEGASKKGKSKTSDPFSALREADALLATIPSPTMIPPPEQVQPHEQPYISELYAAYGDKEGIPDFNDNHLLQYADYADDKKERRIDYFSAESIRLGVREIYGGEYSNQFDVLKEETYAGVKNAELRVFKDGYERMLEVMQRACDIEVSQYVLSRSPKWISNRIKMGVCHFLVNDKKLRWVKK